MIRRTSWPLTPRKLAQRVRKSPRRIHWAGTRSPPRGWDLGVRSAGSAVGAREVRGIAWAPPSSPSFPVTAQMAVSCAGFVRHGAPPLRPAPSPWSFAPAAGQTGGATRVCALQVPLVASRTLSPCSFPASTTWGSPRPPRGVAAWDRRVAKAVPCQSSPLCAGEHSPRAANPVLLSFGSAWRGGPRHGPRGGCWTEPSLPTEKSLEGLTASRAVAPSLGGQASRSRGSGFEADPVF